MSPFRLKVCSPAAIHILIPFIDPPLFLPGGFAGGPLSCRAGSAAGASISYATVPARRFANRSYAKWFHTGFSIPPADNS
jgi:hypothetical protein